MLIRQLSSATKVLARARAYIRQVPVTGIGLLFVHGTKHCPDEWLARHDDDELMLCRWHPAVLMACFAVLMACFAVNMASRRANGLLRRANGLLRRALLCDHECLCV
jgi:hypothetical protein